MIGKRINKQTIAFLIVLLSSIIGGGVSPFTKIVLKVIPPMTYTLIRFFLSLIFIVFVTQKMPKINKKTLPVICLSLLSTLNIVLFAFGIKMTTATVAQALYAAVPVITALLTAKLLKEKLTTSKVAGIILSLVGFAIIILLPILGKSDVFQGNLVGNLLIFIGVISYSFYTTLSKRYQKEYSPTQLTAFFFLTTTLAQLILVPFEIYGKHNWISLVNIQTIVALGYIIVLATILSYWLYQYIIKIGGSIMASMSLYISPVATFAWSAILLGEKLTVGLLIGGLLALVGVWITSRS